MDNFENNYILCTFICMEYFRVSLQVKFLQQIRMKLIHFGAIASNFKKIGKFQL